MVEMCVCVWWQTTYYVLPEGFLGIERSSCRSDLKASKSLDGLLGGLPTLESSTSGRRKWGGGGFVERCILRASYL